MVKDSDGRGELSHILFHHLHALQEQGGRVSAGAGKGGRSARVYLAPAKPGGMPEATEFTPGLTDGQTDLAATADLSDSSVADVNGRVTWSSSDESVATVDVAGGVSPLSPGSATKLTSRRTGSAP